MTEAYPLAWPGGWPRTPSHARESDRRFHGKNYRLSVGRARDQLLDELRLLGATNLLVSSNLPTRSDGLLHSDPRRVDDPGISVWFRYKNKQMVMARDGYISVAGNLRSLGLAIEGLRQLERHGGSLMLEHASRASWQLRRLIGRDHGARCSASKPIGTAISLDCIVRKPAPAIPMQAAATRRWRS